MTTLANTIRFEHGRYAEAEDLYRKSLEIELRAMGPDHPYTTAAKEGLANVLSEEHRYAEAETLLREILISASVFSAPITPTLFYRSTTWQLSSSTKTDTPKLRN